MRNKMYDCAIVVPQEGLPRIAKTNNDLLPFLDAPNAPEEMAVVLKNGRSLQVMIFRARAPTTADELHIVQLLNERHAGSVTGGNRS